MLVVNLPSTLVNAKVDGVIERRAVIRGKLHDVDCASGRNESSPAADFLNALKAGKWDRADSDLPADEQISDYHWFLTALKHWANYGEPIYRNAAKHLDGGVWEFRHSDKRLTFYDTDGRGGYSAKLPISDHAQADVPGSQYWEIPLFDEQIRLGHAFTKVGQKTPGKDLDAMKAVREEDLSHDR